MWERLAGGPTPHVGGLSASQQSATKQSGPRDAGSLAPTTNNDATCTNANMARSTRFVSDASVPPIAHLLKGICGGVAEGGETYALHRQQLERYVVLFWAYATCLGSSTPPSLSGGGFRRALQPPPDVST